MLIDLLDTWYKEKGIMVSKKILGVLGGMGPAATAEFLRILSDKTPVDTDQQHPKVFVYSNPETPDRTECIINGAPSPLPFLKEGLSTLIKWGADYLVITCNTSHFFVDQFSEEIRKRLISIIDSTINSCIKNSPEGAWLTASLGTMQTEIYQKRAQELGYHLDIPTKSEQIIVHDVISCVKANQIEKGASVYKGICNELWSRKDQPVIGACTELPIAYAATNMPIKKMISSLDALAEASLKALGYTI